MTRLRFLFLAVLLVVPMHGRGAAQDPKAKMTELDDALPYADGKLPMEACASDITPANSADSRVMRDVYMPFVRRRIEEHWKAERARDEKLKKSKAFVVMHFWLARDGKLTGLHVYTASGNEELDRAAWETIENATPFPPFPAAATSAEVKVRMCFKVQGQTNINGEIIKSGAVIK